MELNGASPVARDVYAFYFLRPVGRIDQAIGETQQALSLDPLSILFRVHLGFLFYVQRQNEHSIAQFRKVLEMSPNYYLAHAMLGQVYTGAGDFNEAMACYQRARVADVDSRFVDSLEAMTLAAAGRRKEALALLDRITGKAASGYISPVSIAYIHTFLGDADKAFAELERGVEERDPNILGLKSNPIFDRLRSDERYAILLRKMHLEN